MSEPSDFERLRDLVFARQTCVKFIADLQLRDAGGGMVEVIKDYTGEWHKMTPSEAVELWKKRETALRNAEIDPFRQADEPAVWDEIDWEICKLRVNNPNVAVEMLVQGGNGSGKSYYGICRQIRCGVYNSGWLIWNFTTDELKSKTVMQQIAYRYLPVELRPDNPNVKVKRNRDQHIIFKNASGFTDNKIGFPSPPTAPGQPRKRGSVMQFRYHSAELDTLTGPRPHTAYSDEEITLPWVDAITNRLHTFAEKATPNIPMFKELLAQKARNPSMKFPPHLVHVLFLGVHLITFTCEHGYNSVVHSFIKDATTIREVFAELLPLKSEDGADHIPKDEHGANRSFEWMQRHLSHEEMSLLFEKVPKLQHCKLKHRAVFYMHPYENVHGGNWEGMKVAAKTKTRENILWWAYGIASRKSHVLFPKFSIPTHVRPHAQMLKAAKGGTWWMSDDPAPGRNMVCLWVQVNALNELFVMREWPQEDDYVPGHGFLGSWAIQGQKLDGEKGPAQNPLGMGIEAEANEMERVEKELHHDEHGFDGRVQPLVRIMDSRTGNTPTMADSETRTLIQLFADKGLEFVPSGKEAGAKDGETGVYESAKLISSLLDYDAEKIRRDPETGAISFLGKAPRMYVSERCTNLIFALMNWTNADGQRGACKDQIDALKFLAQADPYYQAPRKEEQQFAGVY